LQPLTGGPGQDNKLVSVSFYDSLGAWAAHRERIADDRERQAFLREPAEKQLFVEGTRVGNLYITI
jgi:hypothetical protein